MNGEATKQEWRRRQSGGTIETADSEKAAGLTAAKVEGEPAKGENQLLEQQGATDKAGAEAAHFLQ